EDKFGPRFGGEESAPDEPDPADGPADDSTEAKSAAEETADTTSPGWKNQPSRPLPEEVSPATIAQKSRAVETVIYATPQAPAKGAAPQKESQNDAVPSR